MARLGEQLGEWLSRVELLARGAERQRVEAERALAAGRPWVARDAALSILDELPRSRVALALWADAAEAALLDHEVLEALERLARELPFRADVWLRMAEARWRLGQSPAEALTRAVELGEPAGAADSARLWLADLDLARGDAVRAERWLEQLSLSGRGSTGASLRRLEIALDSGQLERARALGAGLPEPDVLDGRGWLLKARWSAATGSKDPTSALTRALLLGAHGAILAAALLVEAGAEPATRARIGAVVDDVGLAEHPIWRWAVARAEGRPKDALLALAEGARAGGDAELCGRYLGAVVEAREPSLLAEALDLAKTESAGVRAIVRALSSETPAEKLDALDGAGGIAADWAEALRESVFRRWLEAPIAWRELCGELTRSARLLGELEVSRDIEGVLRDLDRPLRVAIVGEFNAGKSSLINALLGEDVAPVGILPTTATLNTLVWAPDRFARIERRAGEPDRLVPHSALRETLRELDPTSVERVTIFAPLELLRKIELVDTPGFNAPDAAHAKTARAAFRDAHVVVWLLDATQPLKASERLVLEEVRAMGLPLCVLMNKIDRLPDEKALAGAREHVDAGLREVGLEPLGGVVAFSARLALEGRAGASDAALASRWADVERWVEQVLVEQSAELSTRASLRRMASSARALASAAERRFEQERARAEVFAGARARLAEAAADLVARRSDWERRLTEHFGPPLAAFQSEVLPVVGMLEDRAARRFVEQRGREVLAPALLDELERLLAVGEAAGPSLAQALLPRLEALVAGRAVGLVARARVAEPAAASTQGRAELGELARGLADLALDELGQALAAAASGLEVEVESPLSARARALARSLSQ